MDFHRLHRHHHRRTGSGSRSSAAGHTPIRGLRRLSIRWSRKCSQAVNGRETWEYVEFLKLATQTGLLWASDRAHLVRDETVETMHDSCPPDRRDVTGK